ncbi:hypothetical protein [Pseudonocardia aurantiaca]|uniref:ARB-07466-like C-terminal domain-containing protein n=1 Tax=Pseudonocardia aurantiaca TaxID=75290 RepID=A0ABW4FU61_9PSEU
MLTATSPVIVHKRVVAAAAIELADCHPRTSGLGAVEDYVRAVAEFLGCRFDVRTMHGVGGRAGPSDHPDGLAVDFMVDPDTGDDLASCALDNIEDLAVKYVIWEQRINHGDEWEPMEDRGGITVNHFDHVHISFESDAPEDVSIEDLCS